jgi:glycosyltransferase involved in cell wall biosynthesis
VAVPTFRRTADLRELLPLLLTQLEAVERQTAGRVTGGDLIVVDNDPEQSGHRVCDEVGDVRVRYLHERTPGVVAVRNRALAEARGELLAFIDDDERPSGGWLRELVGTHLRTGAAAVRGPVVSVFEPAPAPWLAAGGFWERRRWPTGTVLREASTNNLLLDLRVVRRLGLSFSPRFALAGGEDSDFTRALVRAGGTIVACDEAEASDIVRTERLTPRWALLRSLSHGNTVSLVALEDRGDIPATVVRARLFGEGGVRVLVGLGRLALGGVTWSVRTRARGARLVARGCGMCVGAAGYAYLEYARSGPRLRRWRAAQHGAAGQEP